ncbi:hypothetical protein GLOIN_2v1767934 [Rhizophagus irregularis DAOM 181602=DAOM 197198]|uniref:Uncharacterized protein n=1 Tax=Rhizophagus irregularis (strain DAOM 181602 / DAOM 197198 / MUCL 43194) TaxID=747089 RepID=A0A2P4QIB7_RHIID|nr:hypothetical protein GLOIN_2v1767934 [Rhizophagus irregularis DAOM 181602=DAOM 197198]POG77366.1 hypothetical protein GLOIN_2v1767934 [Rhizophagus irregularis DAOM 181602=DAOM 197198]|eukprot:XP_025184232.1 hypothetical protein GLOIN_2v1767934 [Rhizophagus irregularis DAOM 181602=DAOM 197198]
MERLERRSERYTVINAHLRSADVGGVSDGSAGGNGDGGEDGGDGRMNTANYECWLKLVETNNLISVDNGILLYQEYKEKPKKQRLEMVKNI